MLQTLRLLTENQQVGINTINTYDFSKMRSRVLKDGSVSLEEVDEAIGEFRKFLCLILLDYGNLAMMSGAVDEIWHAFILHTREYEAFCQNVIGHFIHHQPASDDSPVSPESGERFVNAYREVFGELNPIWNIEIDCDYSKCDYAGCTNCSTNCSS